MRGGNSESFSKEPTFPEQFDAGDQSKPSPQSSAEEPVNASSSVRCIPSAPLHGILRHSTLGSRQTPSSVVPSDIMVDLRLSLCKGALLVFIPLVGYLLSQLYPSSLLFHFALFCFVYGLVDLVGQDPALSLAFSISPVAAPSSQERRNRKVDFAEGTKFYRMPKPMSRKQKQAFCEQRFRYPPFESANGQAAKPDHQRRTFSPPLSMPTAVTSRLPSPPATIDWEATNRLLKSIIEPKVRQSQPPQQQQQKVEKDSSTFAFDLDVAEARSTLERLAEPTNDDGFYDAEEEEDLASPKEADEGTETQQQEGDTTTSENDGEVVEASTTLEEVATSYNDRFDNAEEDNVAARNGVEEEEETLPFIMTASSSEENEEPFDWSAPKPTTKRNSFEMSPSRLIGSDSAIARLRMVAKPLQDLNRQQVEL